MRVKIIDSPNAQKKLRAVLDDGRTVDFGARGYSDYTLHRDPVRMRAYVRRHGGRILKRAEEETRPADIHQLLLRSTRSNLEDWSVRGVDTPGFWSRWLLWSFPSKRAAAAHIKQTFGIFVDLPTRLS